MSNLFRFRVGDRVRARISGFVPAGTLGTIRQILYSVTGMDYVAFAGFAQPQLMHARDLEPVAEKPEATDEAEKAS